VKAVKTAFGVILIVFGAWLILLEVGMLVSESHAFHGSAIAIFTFVVLVGGGLVYLGYRLVR
jgi:hypothetical protein